MRSVSGSIGSFGVHPQDDIFNKMRAEESGRERGKGGLSEVTEGQREEGWELRRGNHWWKMWSSVSIMLAVDS